MFNILNDDPELVALSYLSEEIVDMKAMNLKAEYAKWNKKLFNNELPDIPIALGRMKDATGLTSATVVKKGKRFSSVRDIKMKLSTNLKLTRQEFDEVLIHEMIHVYFFHVGINAGHGPEFKVKASELSKKVGFKIPLTHAVQNSEVDEKSVKPKEHAFLLLIRSGKPPALAFFGPPKAAELSTTVFDRMIKIMPSGSEVVVGKVRTLLGSKYPIFRSTKTIKTVEISDDELQSIMKTADILRKEVKQA